MVSDRSRNSTSTNPNQWEIKPKDAKLPLQTKVKDFIREQFCCRPPGERRPDRADKVRASFNTGLQDIREKLDSIPAELKELFTRKTNSLMKEFETYYERTLRHYGSQSGTEWKFFRNLSEHSMKLTEASLQEMKEDLDLLRSFQKAREEHEDALKSVRPDNQSLVREWADTQIESAMKKYSLALQSRASERSEAKKQIEETSRRLKESSKALNLKKFDEMQRQLRVDDIQARVKNAPASTSNDTLPHIEQSVANEVINDFKQAHLQVLENYQQSRDTQSLQDARKRFEKAYDRVRTLSEYFNHWDKIQEFKVKIEAAHSEDTPYNKAIKDLFDKTIDTVRNAYQDVLACLQDGWPLRGEDIGDAVKKGADQRFQKACDQLKTLREASPMWKQIHELQEKYNEALGDPGKGEAKRAVEIADQAFRQILDPSHQREDRPDSKQSIKKSYEQLKAIVKNDLYEKWIEVQNHEKRLHQLYRLPNVWEFKELSQETREIVEKNGLSSFSSFPSFREIETQALSQLQEIWETLNELTPNKSFNVYCENTKKVKKIGKLLLNCKKLIHLDQLSETREFKNVIQKHDHLLNQLENLDNKEDLKLLYSFKEARKEHEEALNSVRQDYQFLVRKLAETPIASPMADYGLAVLQGDHHGQEWLHAKKQIEETSRWLKERSMALKKLGEMQINHQIEQIEHKLQLGNAHSHHQDELDPIEEKLIETMEESRSSYSKKLQQFNKERNGEVKRPTLMPDQWRQEFEEISANITLTLMYKSPELPITDKWAKCCTSHDALVTCMGDEFKTIDPDIHKKLETYKKNMANHKERRDELDKHLGEYKSLFAEARELESQLDEARELEAQPAKTRELESQLASKEDELKSALAKAKQLIANMEAEHEKFKEYLRDRGWLEKDASTRVPVSHSVRSPRNITSTSGS